MTHPPTQYQAQAAMRNELVQIEFSTATWLMIQAVLRGWHPPIATDRNRVWAADHINRKLSEHHGYAEHDERTTAS